MDRPEREQYQRNSEKERREEAGQTLPPRSKVRREKKKKSKFKLKYPLITVLSIFFISLPIVAYFVYKNYAANQAVLLSFSQEEDETGYEVVDFAEPSDVTVIPQKEKEKPAPEIKQNQSAPLKEQARQSETVFPKEQQEEKTEGGEEQKSSYKIIKHTVQGNETLFSIAMKYYNDVKGTKLIRKWNKLENGKLRQGQVLSIPIKESGSSN
ncbi:LysM peptidoglycan-binding domain-containing protein [Bacillus songklensis]|uniref:LysM peptidoglycan-binding domain-containing protein n=1 Tax=Bacillus songklensis TaxID=1069116 RepID=A0ABV8AYV7_9BACI